jgi:hypothetical protein
MRAVLALFLPLKRFQCFRVKDTGDWRAPVALEFLYCGSCFCAHQSVRRANVVTKCPKPLLSVLNVLFCCGRRIRRRRCFRGRGRRSGWVQSNTPVHRAVQLINCVHWPLFGRGYDSPVLKFRFCYRHISAVGSLYCEQFPAVQTIHMAHRVNGEGASEGNSILILECLSARRHNFLSNKQHMECVPPRWRNCYLLAI